MQKWAEVNYEKCDPKKCNPKDGICVAAQACTHDILEQEEQFEIPMHLSREMCVGCGDCVNICPLNAIKIISGGV